MDRPVNVTRSPWTVPVQQIAIDNLSGLRVARVLQAWGHVQLGRSGESTRRGAIEVTAEFTKGDTVRRCADPGAIGVVQEVLWDSQDEEYYARVMFANGLRTIPITDLEPFGSMSQGDMWSSISDLKLAPAARFRRLITWERLRKPATPIVAAFGTARAKLYPYQFKPLLKFLNHPDHRILIADDVGLGKTIEAGYILREWRARNGLERALILVPARLRTKWKSELKKRFDEEFELVASRDIVHHLREMAKGREPEPFRWIASYESMRRREVVELLDEVQPPIDLVVLDEAHRVRNSQTAQYQVARTLSRTADGLVFLTATPVQTGLDNLYTLLNLLEPERYGYARTFEEQIEANRPVVRAAQLVSAGDYAAAAEELESMANSPHTSRLAREEVFRAVVRRLRSAHELGRVERVALQRDIDDFSLTGHVISRTRKVEVMKDRPVRVPQNPRIVLTPDEEAIYDSVRAITRLLYPDSAAWGQSMAALMAFRYTASCIPAGAAYMRERLQRDGVLWDDAIASVETDGDLEDDEYGGPGATGNSEDIAVHIANVLRRCPAPGTDSKYQVFAKTLAEIWRDDRQAGRVQRKVIVFSYFRRTLRYLDEQLTRERITHRVIHGGVGMEDREARVEDFLSDPGVNVLLSSEVGGEGLDLQRASVVVNYDLPWNPMVVEQRIGRIDRIGQKQQRLTIVNLISDQTVEERILYRLYDRIDVFRGSIGELEDILGPADVTRLMAEALRGDLTEEQLERQVDQTADQIERSRLQAKRLASNVDGLLAADQAFLDELDALLDRRRVPMQDDLYDLLVGFLEDQYEGIGIDGRPRDGRGSLQLGHRARGDFRRWAQKQSGWEATRVATRADRGNLPFTMSPDAAMTYPRTEFVQHRHPLIQFAVDRQRDEFEPHTRSFGIALSSRAFESGPWLMGVWRIDSTGRRVNCQVEVVAQHLVSNRVLVGESAEDLLIAAVHEGRELDPRPALSAGLLDGGLDAIKQRFHAVFRETRDAGQQMAQRRHARMRATWEATLRLRLDRAANRLRDRRSTGAADFSIRMAEAQLRKREEELRVKLDEFARTPEPRYEYEDLAAALVVVRMP